MSRNVRHKQNPHVGQKSSKKTAPTNKDTSSSSDDDYAGVELVSDSSDEEEPDVEKVETSAIMEAGEVTDVSDNDQDSQFSHQFSLGELDDEGFSGNFFDETQFFDDQIIPELETESEDEPVEKPRPRTRVRFLSPSAASSSSIAPDESPGGAHYTAGDPNIFWDCDSLAPGFRQIIYDEDVPSSDASSYWDLEAELGTSQVGLMGDDSDSDHSSSGGSSGYETESDEGETTDEEVPMLHAPRPVPSKSVLQSDSEEEVPIIRNKGPRIGSFVQEPQKPYAMLDKTGTRLLLYKARSGRRDLPDQLFSPMFEGSSMTGAANVMVSAMLEPSTAFFGQSFGPPEAFYAFPSFNPDSSSYDEGEDEDDDEDEALDYNAFVHFGDETSDEDDEEGEEGAGGEEGHTSTFSAKTPPHTATAEEEQNDQERGNSNVLDHLKDKKNLVGAFRNNQRQHQLISRNAATRDGLEFAGRLGQGPIRGIKGGRLAAANTPITPMRKQKNPKSMIGSSPGSPLAPTAAQKRKSSGELPNNHKRTRSIG